MNNRRKLVIALGAGALVAPFASFAQQQGKVTAPLASIAQQQRKVWRIGFLSTRVRPASLDSGVYGGFLTGMRELGYVEGKNFVIEWRFAENRSDRLAELTAELVQLKVDVIVAGSSTTTVAAQKATTTIPIVMASANDPVGTGLVKSLARPGGNTTGHSNQINELSPKHLELLQSMVPKLSRIAVLINPNNPSNATALKNVQVEAQRTGATILSMEARTPPEIEDAFSMMAQKKAGAVIIVRDAFLIQQARQIALLTAKYRLPSISAIRDHVDAGGLISYGPSLTDELRRTATYVDKILKGAKPKDLPVEQPTKFEMFVSGRAAKALGLKIPDVIMLRADKVIE